MKPLVLLILCVLIFNGCTSINQFLYGTPEQQAALLKAQREAVVPLAQFDQSYEVTFRSTLRAIVDLGFVVRSSDMTSGFISASYETKDAPAYQYLSLWSMSSSDESVKNFSIGVIQEVSILVDKISDVKTEVKITTASAKYIEEVNGQGKMRPLQWNEGVSNKQIFDRLQSELDRRKAL